MAKAMTDTPIPHAEMTLSPKAKRYVLNLLDNALEHLRVNLAHEGDEDAISDLSNDLDFVLSIKRTLETEADTQADLTEMAIDIAMWRNDPDKLRALIAAALQAEREAAAAEARRAALEDVVQWIEFNSNYLFSGRDKHIGNAIIKRIRALASPAPQAHTQTRPCHCDETQCYSAQMQPGWYCKKQAQVASPAPQEE